MKKFSEFVAEKDLKEVVATPANQMNVQKTLMNVQKSPLVTANPQAQAKVKQAMAMAKTGQAPDATTAMDMAGAATKATQ